MYDKTVEIRLGQCDAFMSHSWSDDGSRKYDLLHEWAGDDDKRLCSTMLETLRPSDVIVPPEALKPEYRGHCWYFVDHLKSGGKLPILTIEEAVFDTPTLSAEAAKLFGGIYGDASVTHTLVYGHHDNSQCERKTVLSCNHKGSLRFWQEVNATFEKESSVVRVAVAMSYRWSARRLSRKMSLVARPFISIQSTLASCEIVASVTPVIRSVMRTVCRSMR